MTDPPTQGYGAFNCDNESSRYAGDPYDVESLIMEIGTFVLMAVVSLLQSRKMVPLAYLRECGERAAIAHRGCWNNLQGCVLPLPYHIFPCPCSS